jgi:hypothetical protein
VSSRFQTAEGHTVVKLTDSRYDRARQTEEITAIYDETDGDGITRRTIIPMTLRYAFRFELELLLRLAGLHMEVIYGDYDLSVYDEDAARMIVVSTKDG